METIQSQLDLYDEQIKNIDKQISEITAQQIKEEIEKQHSKLQDNRPKTIEDIQNQKLANITKTQTRLRANMARRVSFALLLMLA